MGHHVHGQVFALEGDDPRLDRSFRTWGDPIVLGPYMRNPIILGLCQVPQVFGNSQSLGKISLACPSVCLCVHTYIHMCVYSCVYLLIYLDIYLCIFVLRVWMYLEGQHIPPQSLLSSCSSMSMCIHIYEIHISR